MKTEIKTEVLRLVEQLLEDAIWEDLQPATYLRQAVDRGVADSAAEEVKRATKYALTSRLAPVDERRLA